HDAAAAVALGLEELGGGREAAGAVVERSAAVSAPGGFGAGEFVFNFGVDEGVEGAESLAGGRVDGGDHECRCFCLKAANSAERRPSSSTSITRSVSSIQKAGSFSHRPGNTSERIVQVASGGIS